MSRDENQTRVELINPALFARGWNDALVREEKTLGGVDIIDGVPRKRRGRTDYLLCVPVEEGKPPVPVALIEAKAEFAYKSGKAQILFLQHILIH